MHRAVRAVLVLIAAMLMTTSALAQDVKLLETFRDWSVYAATGNPKVCFAVSKPTSSNPSNVKRGPILFYISQWPEDKVVNEISVKMGYPFSEGAKATVTVGSAKFELFTKDEGAFVEKPDEETKLIEAMKAGNSMKIDGTSSRGTKTSDAYSLLGISDALARVAKDCSG
jgi:invasion protein IalB